MICRGLGFAPVKTQLAAKAVRLFHEQVLIRRFRQFDVLHGFRQVLLAVAELALQIGHLTPSKRNVPKEIDCIAAVLHRTLLLRCPDTCRI
jgi:hypothetical protein